VLSEREENFRRMAVSPHLEKYAQNYRKKTSVGTWRQMIEV
jgi:hypothetical protein